ncbi:hypothetical protein [Branchiibius hedensis]|nr:hypothetical protein [Branchiibius hedensis]
MNISMSDGYDPQTDDAETIQEEQVATEEGMPLSPAEEDSEETDA